MIARLVTDTPTPYVLRGHTLAEVQAQLPPGLERTERQFRITGGVTLGRFTVPLKFRNVR
jgi:hypothetical protein